MGSSERRRKRKAPKRKVNVPQNRHHQHHQQEKNQKCSRQIAEVYPFQIEVDSPNTSASALKLNSTLDSAVSNLEDGLVNNEECGVGECNFIMNSDIFLSTMMMIGRCPDCLASISVRHLFSKKQGFAQFFLLDCNECSWTNEMCNSKEILSNKPGVNAYEFNTRSIIAFREIGRGYEAIKTFSTILNMPPPMTKTAYKKTLAAMHIAYIKTSNSSMQKAANEIRKNVLQERFDEGTIVDTRVSLDGSWQRRGYASLNGVVTAMSNGKCVDTEVMSKQCKSCQFWNRKKGTDGYTKWLESHDCKINHKGSAGKMESDGAVKIFKKSIYKGLRYTTYIGDGDTKSYQEVVNTNPYPGHVIAKAECVGHVQKRVGTRLRDLKVKYKGRKLADGKGLTGKGRMTDKVINTLQNYYGMAIRQNKDNLYGMKKSVAAVIHHCSSATTNEERHLYCPRNVNSWCKYQADKISGKETYKQKISIPPTVSDVIKPIFSHKGLGSDELLKKCLHGTTQNVNESINNVIWQKCPKRVYVGRQTVETGVASAVIAFNDGGQGLLPVFELLGINPGLFTINGLSTKDADRIKIMNKKETDGTKQRRKKLRSIRKGFQDTNIDKEGETYASGSF